MTPEQKAKSKSIANPKLKLKPLNDQVIVITGASSGIGLATARLAASRGAKVVLSSRNLQALLEICTELTGRGGKVLAVEADVSLAEDMKRLAERSLAEFGRIDTWVNNAGLSIYGKLTEIPLEEKRRLFDVNFWGVVNGCRAAVPILRESGGALINIGSILSERAVPIQGIYSASKHAVKAYTDALRMELEAEGAPVSVTLVKPAAIDTPFPAHAVSHLSSPPQHAAPVYAPEIVAEAILECAVSGQRDIFVGGSAKWLSLLETFLPRIADMLMEKNMMEDGQSSSILPVTRQKPALFHAPHREGAVHGDYNGRVKTTSAYTTIALHPGTAALIAAGLGMATAVGIGLWQSKKSLSTEQRILH